MIIREYVDSLINARRYNIINTNESSNKKIFKIHNVIVDYDDNSDIPFIEKSYTLVIKEYKNIVLEASKRLLEYHNMVDNNQIVGNYNIKSLAEKLKLYSILVSTFPANKTHNDIITYHMTFDTNPPLDKTHVFTLYVNIDIKTNNISFKSVYDG